MNEKLESLLKKLNLSENEAKVYLAALDLGPTTITKLAAKAGVERATVYALLERLREKGLAAEDAKDYSRDVQVEAPDKLVWLIKRKKRLLAEEEHELNELLPDWLSQVNARGKQPKVRFYEGKEQFINVFDSALEEAKDKMYFFGAASLFVDLISYQFEKDWIKKRVRKNIHIDILVHKTSLTEQFKSDDKKEKRTTRFLPADMKFEGSFMLWSHKVAFWNPIIPLAIVIEDQVVADMLQAVFKGLWKK